MKKYLFIFLFSLLLAITGISNTNGTLTNNDDTDDITENDEPINKDKDPDDEEGEKVVPLEIICPQNDCWGQ